MKNKKGNNKNKKEKSHEPNDGTFISYKENDEFNSNGSSRYGYEQDSCDIWLKINDVL